MTAPAIRDARARIAQADAHESARGLVLAIAYVWLVTGAIMALGATTTAGITVGLVIEGVCAWATGRIGARA
jgi:hypothetical protein